MRCLIRATPIESQPAALASGSTHLTVRHPHGGLTDPSRHAPVWFQDPW
jgi:hypothetical protein